MSGTSENGSNRNPGIAKSVLRASDVLKEMASAGLVNPPKTSRPEREYLERFQSAAIETQTAYAHLQGIQDHYWHKGKWSWFLMAAVGGMIVFQSILLWKVGKGQLDFTSYEWLLPALLVQNLGQVIGLAVYAVRFLFSDISGKKPQS